MHKGRQIGVLIETLQTLSDISIKSKQHTVLAMDRAAQLIADTPCDNTATLISINQSLLKSGTVMNIDSMHNTADRKYCVSPVVKTGMKPKDENYLPKLVESLKKLSKTDPLVLCITETYNNTVALVGVNQILLKSGLLMNIDDAHNIATMKCSVSPIVKMDRELKDEKNLPKLDEGLKKLSNVTIKLLAKEFQRLCMDF